LATSEASARVGRGFLDHRFEHLGSVMTGLPIFTGAADDVLLQRGNLSGAPQHQITTGNHHGRQRFRGCLPMFDGLRLFELRMSQTSPPRARARSRV